MIAWLRRLLTGRITMYARQYREREVEKALAHYKRCTVAVLFRTGRGCEWKHLSADHAYAIGIALLKASKPDYPIAVFGDKPHRRWGCLL